MLLPRVSQPGNDVTMNCIYYRMELEVTVPLCLIFFYSTNTVHLYIFPRVKSVCRPPLQPETLDLRPCLYIFPRVPLSVDHPNFTGGGFGSGRDGRYILFTCHYVATSKEYITSANWRDSSSKTRRIAAYYFYNTQIFHRTVSFYKALYWSALKLV